MDTYEQCVSGCCSLFLQGAPAPSISTAQGPSGQTLSAHPAPAHSLEPAHHEPALASPWISKAG